jgi:carbamoyltransferase
MLYSVFTAFLGFEVNEGEYKVMGMAPYGTPRYMDKVWKLVRTSADGAIELDLDYFSYHLTPRRAFSDKFLALFGEPRSPYGPDDARDQGRHYADIAASLQKVTEEILLRMSRAAAFRSGSKRLVMAGGVALNCVANGRIQDEAGIDELFVQPAAGDGGASLGAALWAWHAVLGKPRGAQLPHVSWGRAVPGREIQSELELTGASGVALKSDEELLDRATEDLLSGKVIGWSQGRFEWGPRALGNRSILADPRRGETRELVNTKIKFRETFRPFAPSLTEESAACYFEQPLEHQPTVKFMLRTASVRSGMRQRIPAVTHVDGSARPHLVERTANPLYFDLIRRFGDASGDPVLLNTSFNLRGEPIVASAADALATFFRSGLDVLYLENYRVTKQGSRL